MVRDLKAAKKPYAPPSFEVLDAAAAKLELEVTGVSPDANTRHMWSAITKQLDRKTAQLPRGPLS
ncbi:MAG: hypothetical protein ACRD23_17760 [Terriglobales bacterium]